MNRQKKTRIFAIMIIILVLLFAIAIVNGNKKSQIKENIKLPVSVELAEVANGSIDAREIYTGTLEGKEQTDVVSQTAGVIEKILFAPGQNCKIGQVLLVVEGSQQEAAVEQAKAQVMAAETNYQKAQKDLTRIEQLYNDKVTTKDNLELTQLNVKSAFAQLKGAQAGLKAAEKLYSDTQIKATINGKIATKLVNLGQTISPGVPIARLVNDSEFKLKIYVPEVNIIALKANQTVDVTVDVLPDANITGRVKSVGLAFEGESKSYPVEIMIPHSGSNELKSGMFARCTIETGKKANALLVPENAVIIDNNEYIVYVAEGDKAIKKKIEIGLKNEQFYEVKSGLSLGMKVITNGKDQVTDGAKIVLGDK